MTALRGYWRRRGWHAWHVAMLARCDPKQFPELAALTGEAARRGPQTPEQLLHAVRMWKSAMGPAPGGKQG